MIWLLIHLMVIITIYYIIIPLRTTLRQVDIDILKLPLHTILILIIHLILIIMIIITHIRKLYTTIIHIDKLPRYSILLRLFIIQPKSKYKAVHFLIVLDDKLRGRVCDIVNLWGVVKLKTFVVWLAVYVETICQCVEYL